ncbi:(2Fe-2S) ferredoxin domain-containing protein [Candidatus Sumerlaeota bacterium]|nr:(2Fe-2S) ferredoxin domain-containing protein [Candidatus Sumerlaeota bacterium]
MGKLTIQELEKLREKAREQLKLRTTGETRGKIIVHMGTCGISAGARDVLSALLEAIEKKGIKDIIVTTSGCAGMCSREPMATVELAGQPPVKYVDLDKDKIVRILEEHVIGGKIVKEYALGIGSERVG